MNDIDWVQLKRGDDWGYIYLAIDPLKNGFASADRGIKVTAGENVTVKFPDCPDGTVIINATIALITETHTVSDHGKENKVTSQIPAIEDRHHGMTIKIPLDKLLVPRKWAIEHGAK